MKIRLAFAVLALTAVAWFVWERSRPSVRPGACAGCNVLLITIDTLRLDRVGAFGGPAGLTPHLDRLAAEGLRLTRTYSSAPLTLPSHTSIMTAVSPPVHGVRTNGLFRLGAALPTLATVLKAAGYRTGAFVGAFVLDARFGLNRGFDVYDDRYGEKHTGDPTEGAERRAEEVIKPAAAWILDGGHPSSATSHQPPATNPWFAWVHLYDPHEPYRAPEPYASQHEPYDAEVAYADAMVGRLLDDLRSAGQLDRTLVVVASDHGESLGEHGERTHGVFTYDATMRVPWIVWAGSRLPSASTDALVRLIDVAPTTLDLVGVAAPPSFEGRSALPEAGCRTWFAQTPPARTAYIEAMDANLTRNWAPLTGIVSGSAKLIELPIPELYDLSSDPKEATNLFTRDAERARTLSALLRESTSAFLSRGSAAEKTTLGGEARQRLQALGYVASSAEPGNRVFTDADDPKTLIGPANDLQRAVIAFNTGSRAPAMDAVRAIVRAHPGFTTAHGMLASMQRESGDLRGAIATLEDVLRRGIADQSVMIVLAGYLQEAGDAAKSVALLEAVVAAHPDYAEAYNSLGVAYMRLGRHDQARAALRKVLDLDPTSAKAYENLGADELSVGDLAAGVDDLKRAIDLDPLLYDALYNLALALHDLGRRDEARPYLERFVREAPQPRYARDIAKLQSVFEKSGTGKK
ncbi:MAG: sulfatase-like hydrolase/transferase [Acidobacteriia bacterium]|nr:sulfatase-like hydrolase/transferase [Terriglobia bacterium]